MKITEDIRGLEVLLERLERLGKNVPETLLPTAKTCALQMQGAVRGLVYSDELKYENGAIAQSIDAYAEATDESVRFGVETGLDITIYQEMGTGPTGTAAGHPGESLMDRPVARKSEGWGPGGKNEGVTPKAFMHNGVQQRKDASIRALRKVLMEALK